jgi:hypothetical protein
MVRSLLTITIKSQAFKKGKNNTEEEEKKQPRGPRADYLQGARNYEFEEGAKGKGREGLEGPSSKGKGGYSYHKPPRGGHKPKEKSYQNST